jgi:hypothetical protein
MINTTRDINTTRRLVQFWHVFQISLVVLIINCTPSRVITYTYCDFIVMLTIFQTISSINYGWRLILFVNKHFM